MMHEVRGTTLNTVHDSILFVLHSCWLLTEKDFWNLIK